MNEKTTQNTQKTTQTQKADFFQKCKGISLIIASSSLLLFVASLVMPTNTVVTEDPYSPTSDVTTYNMKENTADAISIPYTSIYDVTVNDQQLLAVLADVPPCIVTQVEKDLASGATPNQFIMRCAYYNDNIMEDILNEVLGVTLAADWRTDEYYVPDNNENQAVYSDNGYGYNMYGDIED